MNPNYYIVLAYWLYLLITIGLTIFVARTTRDMIELLSRKIGGIILLLGAMHFGIGHGADRGLVNSNLRLEGIVDAPTVVADDTVICRDGAFEV